MAHDGKGMIDYQLEPTIIRALDQGNSLSIEQFRDLIAYEAGLIGLTYDQALRRARTRTLPRNYIGADLQLLIDMLQ